MLKKWDTAAGYISTSSYFNISLSIKNERLEIHHYIFDCETAIIIAKKRH